MKLNKLHVRLIGDKRAIKLNKLNIIHGHEFQGGLSGPVNPARTLFLKARSPTIAGHHHQTSAHTGKDINGKICTCWSMGCLSTLNPRYRPYNSWNLGFAIVDTTGEDDFTVYNYNIWNDRIL